MDIFNLKNKTGLKFIKNHLNKNDKSEIKVYGKIKNVGIIAEKESFESIDFVKSLSNKLEIEEYRMKILLYENRRETHENAYYQYFSEKDFALYGRISDKKLKDFTDTSFDLLVNYITDENTFAKIIVLRSNAVIKAGICNGEENVYSISIKVSDKRIDMFNEELVKYLGILGML